MFGKSRIEAFSDGVIAIIITVMVLELKAPHSAGISELIRLLPKILIYILSFFYVAIYWNNHHHMFSLVEKVNGRILWANTHLLFWLSLIPFTTSWLGETGFSEIATIIYGLVLFMCSVAYYILQITIIKFQGETSKLKRAISFDFKGKFSPILYLVGVIISFYTPVISIIFYTGVAVLWVIPDARIEKIQKKE